MESTEYPPEYTQEQQSTGETERKSVLYEIKPLKLQSHQTHSVVSKFDGEQYYDDGSGYWKILAFRSLISWNESRRQWIGYQSQRSPAERMPKATVKSFLEFKELKDDNELLDAQGGFGIDSGKFSKFLIWLNAEVKLSDDASKILILKFRLRKSDIDAPVLTFFALVMTVAFVVFLYVYSCSCALDSTDEIYTFFARNEFYKWRIQYCMNF
ncbi:unnamed protein product [Lactuca saligna]|uniref:Uncharacterized protein n=1 Tax=Lactuca saligna TaxID=75948 RepID=A0AA35VPI9_LACSI|nr:unnamed protein product [Lactuca saligna]